MAEDVRSALNTAGMEEFEKQFESPQCVLLDSEYCSMGRMIGIRACRLSGYAYYDAVILLELVPECGVTADEVLAYEKKLRREDISKEEIVNDSEYIRISKAFDKAIDIALAKGPCLIHDRAVREMIEAKGYTCITAQTYALNRAAKIVRARVSPLYKDMKDDAEVEKMIREEDLVRINYHKAHSDTRWGDKNIYDICINADVFGRDYSAEILAKAMKGRS